MWLCLSLLGDEGGRPGDDEESAALGPCYRSAVLWLCAIEKALNFSEPWFLRL